MRNFPPSIVVLTLVSLLLAGCASPQRPDIAPLPKPRSVALKMDVTLSQAPLNISIAIFDSGQFNSGALYNSAVQVRSVERRYLPVKLKETFDRSGHWGAVRVMPGYDPAAEINLTGEVLFSDGVEMKLEIRARDATGRLLLDKLYEDVTNDLDYAVDPDYRMDPFQDMYNDIANDLVQAITALSVSAHRNLLDVTTIRYAAELSAESFGHYVAEVEGRYVLVGLPAIDDPLLERVQRIRESEYLFADSVDAHYESLHRKLGPTYAWWRHYSYELTVGNQRLEQIDPTRGATRGSWYAMERVYKTYKESKMNEDALRELSASFDAETAPMVTEVAGRVVALSGTLAFQYEEWRDLLRELYREETGR
jgi:hypothetical protein